MTQENLKEQVYIVLSSYVPLINSKVEHIINSGCIDMERVERMETYDYSLANIIAYCLAKELVQRIKPDTTVALKESINISKFI